MLYDFIAPSPVRTLWNYGEPAGTRTRDHRIKSAMLYQLSYRPVTRGGEGATVQAAVLRHLLRITSQRCSEPSQQRSELDKPKHLLRRKVLLFGSRASRFK